MRGLAGIVVLLPFLSFVVLALGRRLRPRAIALLGVGSVGVAALLTLLVTADFLANPPDGGWYRLVYWTWFDVGRLRPQIAFMIDGLAIIMMLVVSVVGFFIHLYSAAHMRGDEGYRRFFAYMNLFVGSMLLLVMADNLLLLYLGWEGVGLCSFLLIGFWYRDPANNNAAWKALLVTRIGDAAMLIGLIILATQFHTLQILGAQTAAAASWTQGSAIAVATAALLLGGALGKSAQLPLQTWLPDAMAGPSPVSALIHAATMVTAGVYLIARTNALFTLAPQVRLAVAVIGAATLLYAAVSAVAQRDIKRVLAYSTISQIGYMFLALGVGAWAAAIFHLMVHAFFKALLFLSAGVVIEALGGEHDIFKMGGLRRRIPLTFWTFLAGAASLAALPLVTAGYYSKDLIIDHALTSPHGSVWLWLASVTAAFLTSFYIFRVVFRVFFGPEEGRVERDAAGAERLPLLALAVLSLVGGFVNLPSAFGSFHPFSDFLQVVLPAAPGGRESALSAASLVIVPALSLLGIPLAWAAYGAHRGPLWAPEKQVNDAVRRWWLAGWGFDWLYDRLFVRPLLWFVRVSRGDLIEPFVSGVAWLFHQGWRLTSMSQNGLVRLYVAVAGIGAAVLVAVVVLS